MTVKFLHLVVVICISTSSLLAAPTKESSSTKATATSKTEPAAETKPAPAKDIHTNKKTEAEIEEDDEEEEPATANTEGISPFRYVAGGALSILPGFGLGHMVQGRWFDDYGWAFTVGQIVTFAGIVKYVPPYCGFRTRGIMSDGSHYGNHSNSCEAEANRKRKIQPYWMAAFLLFKLGEMVHAWWPRKLAPLQRGETNPDAAVIPRHRYLWGGALGTTVGFGLGHAVQGRWWSRGRGWAYTLTQLPIVPAIYSLMAQESCEKRAHAKERERKHEGESWGCPNSIGEETTGFLIAMFVVSKAIELFNVWDIDYSQHRVADTDKRNSLLLLPYADNRGLGLQLAFSH